MSHDAFRNAGVPLVEVEPFETNPGGDPRNGVLFTFLNGRGWRLYLLCLQRRG